MSQLQKQAFALFSLKGSYPKLVNNMSLQLAVRHVKKPEQAP
jgi:hypothetical protein